MNIMKLVKLVYLLDRLSIARRGIPVVGGTYFALPNGPITSELLDLINSGTLWGEPDCHWDALIGARQDHEVSLRCEAPTYDHLSRSEIALMDEIYAEHGGKDQWALRDWTHAHCEEWTPLEQGRGCITIESIARAGGKSDAEIRQMEDEAAELAFLASALR